MPTGRRRIAGAEWRICVRRARDGSAANGRREHSDRPFVVGRASPFTFIGPKRVNDPGVAFDALPPIDRGAGVALPLRPSRCRDVVATRGRA